MELGNSRSVYKIGVVEVDDDEDDQIEVPSYFICPISLQMMSDPVTICTGITYDRESMERWVFTYKNNICPITKQPLTDHLMTPNHTLRRLIQNWCTENAAFGIQRIPTPKPPVDMVSVRSLLQDCTIISADAVRRLHSLQKLKLLAAESDRNKVCIRSAGTAIAMAAIIEQFAVAQDHDHQLVSDNYNYYNIVADDQAAQQDYNNSTNYSSSSMSMIVEALSILYLIGIKEEELRDLADKGIDLIGSIAWILLNGDYESRIQAFFVLKEAIEGMNPIFLMNLRSDLLSGIVQALNKNQHFSPQTTRCALQILIQVCQWGRNRVKVVECGAVSVLIELLIEASERRVTEILMSVLDLLCGCAEGREEVVKHAAGLAAISRKIMRMSQLTNDKAVKIFHSICKYSSNPSVVQEMLQVGAVTKLCLVLQVDCNQKTKERAKEMLRMHGNIWKASRCAPQHLLSST